MATYTTDKRPKRLRDWDRVIFVVNGEECGHRVISGESGLAHEHRDVFETLGMSPSEKESITERCFGYASTDLAFWPTAKPRDYAAHCRLVNALYDLIEEREGKKAKSAPANATNDPGFGVFLGYDWAQADRDLNRSTEINGNQRYATFEAAAESAKDDSGAPFYVFKLYAVGVKKYSYKLVPED